MEHEKTPEQLREAYTELDRMAGGLYYYLKEKGIEDPRIESFYDQHGNTSRNMVKQSIIIDEALSELQRALEEMRDIAQKEFGIPLEDITPEKLLGYCQMLEKDIGRPLWRDLGPETEH